jgi:YHS domain-containing protein
MNMRTYIGSVLAGAFFIGMTTAALAVTGEYDNMCTMGLANGKDIKTDCSVNSQIQGKTYCFGNQSALTQFMADPSGNLTKAQAYYSKKQPG